MASRLIRTGKPAGLPVVYVADQPVRDEHRNGHTWKTTAVAPQDRVEFLAMYVTGLMYYCRKWIAVNTQLNVD